LSTAIEVSGDWEVALTEITYPRKSFSVVDDNSNIDIWYQTGVGGTPPMWDDTTRLKEGCYESIEEVVNALNAEDDGYMLVMYNGSRIIIIAAESELGIRTSERRRCKRIAADFGTFLQRYGRLHGRCGLCRGV